MHRERIKKDCFTSYGLRLNSHGKNWMINKWVSIITPIISKSRVISTTPLPWAEKSNNSYDEQERRNELVTEGTNMKKENENTIIPIFTARKFLNITLYCSKTT